VHKADHTYTKVDISPCIKESWPREAAVEDLTDRLILLLLEDCVGNTLRISAYGQ